MMNWVKFFLLNRKIVGLSIICLLASFIGNTPETLALPTKKDFQIANRPKPPLSGTTGRSDAAGDRSDGFPGSSADIENFFSNPGIQNIFRRVVGGDPLSNSNVFLINPSGIISGQLSSPSSSTMRHSDTAETGKCGQLGEKL